MSNQFASNVNHPEDIHALQHALTRATIMEKWNLKFSGDDNLSLSEFLLRLELNARADNFCKEDVYVTIFRLLHGTARHWYEGCYDSISNFAELIAALKYRFQPIEYDFYLREEIKLRTQHIDEPAQVYITNMIRLFRKLDPPLPESDRVFIIQKNMLHRYSMQLVIRNVKSVDHISKLCKMIDESGHQASTSDDPLEPSCYPAKKIVPPTPTPVITPKRNLPRPLQIIAKANKAIEEAAVAKVKVEMPTSSGVAHVSTSQEYN